MGNPGNLKLNDGARIAVIGGGPAGSFFSYFLLRVAERVGRRIQVDIYEPRNFNMPGPAGCNMCAGVVSETLVQAAEGINHQLTVDGGGTGHRFLHAAYGCRQRPHLDPAPRKENCAASAHAT
jgi:hypothetical protein